MKKILLLLVTVLIMNVYSITIEFGNGVKELNWAELKDLPQLEIITEREKQAEARIETWRGPLLADILEKYAISNYRKLQIVATDNYLVRLSYDEITSRSPIIAFSRNGESLAEPEYRIIIPEKRDMFWVRDIARIVIEQKAELALPHSLYIAETILSKMPLLPDPRPFEDVSGYFVRDLLQEVYPAQSGNYLLIARDNIRHTLDFDNYLSKAALIKTEAGLSLQSPQMPAGMWIKDLAYIQKDELAIIFSDQFKNWQEIVDLLEWQEIDPDITVEFNKLINERSDQKREFIELKW